MYKKNDSVGYADWVEKIDYHRRRAELDLALW